MVRKFSKRLFVVQEEYKNETFWIVAENIADIDLSGGMRIAGEYALVQRLSLSPRVEVKVVGTAQKA